MNENEAIEQVKRWRKEGAAPDMLKDQLISQGFDPIEAGEVVRKSKMDANANDNTPNENQVESGAFKHRNPVLVAIFSIITFGIYFLYWTFKTSKDIASRSDKVPSLWILIGLIIPILGFFFFVVFFWKYSKAASEITDYSSGLLFFLFLFFHPVAAALVQDSLNKV